MTTTELRGTLSKETVWMASEAIRQGCEAARKTKQESLKQEALEKNGEPFNYSMKHVYYEGVRIAAEVLWKLFAGYSAAVQNAIKTVAKETDIYTRGEEYFDRFVEAYAAEYGTVRIRTEQ
ncbi:MAG: hypothetical protein LBC86_03975 [Oscillospiraceae bacterium]|jgi:hypothetical protein|nr:hypothetical protein [Oscillospiraceae bacterium]